MTEAQINTALAVAIARFPIGTVVRCGNGRGAVYAVGWAVDRVWVWIEGIGRVDAGTVT